MVDVGSLFLIVWLSVCVIAIGLTIAEAMIEIHRAREVERDRPSMRVIKR